MSLELDKHDLKTILSWAQAVKGYWYLREDEQELMDRIQDYVEPPEPDATVHSRSEEWWNSLSESERTETLDMMKQMGVIR